jgi:hypothetical protein
MKQVALIGATLIIAGVSIFFIMGGGKKEMTKILPQQEEAVVTFYKESGFVGWKKQGESDYVRIEADELTLPNNVYIKTADDGRGYVILPDNSMISLDKNTEILVSYSPKKTSIQQLLGQTYHRVESLVSGKEYEVRTPGTLAAVRGTKFGVSYDKKRRKTSVSVTEHKVDVVPIERMDEIATTTGRSVETGNTAILDDAPQVSTTTPEAPVKARTAMLVQRTEKMTEEKKWVDENNLLDKELDKRKEERKEYMKEFIKKMKEEKQESEQTPSPTKVTDETKLRIVVIKKIIQEINVERPDLKADDTVIPSKVEEETKPTEEQKPTTGTPPQPSGAVTPTTPTLKTFDTSSETLTAEDEKFTNDFYTEYEKYFYVDASIGICDRVLNLSKEEIVARLERFTNGAGYILPKKSELTSFVGEIIEACKDRSISNKVPTFQSKFDVVYPFAQ